ncbi:MAG: NAD-dependent epimerase/dehydratase family protein [Pedobacter sp.]|nr:MAG: NAD-dependent epimerase/dehydratase family protein [Pedobacter sp.]
MKTQKIAVLGGTGKAGKYIVKTLLAAGYQLKLLVKDQKTDFDSPNISFIEGDARDYQAISSLLQGCEKVVSAVGQRPGETNVFSQATSNILKAMEALQVNQYIVLTGLNVDTPIDNKGPAAAFGTAWMKENYPLSTADKQLEYDILQASQLDWTLVRLPMIHLTNETTIPNVSLLDCPGDHINASDLAQFIIKLILKSDYKQSAPFIASS